MNRRTTLILLGALAVLGGIAYFLNTNPEAAGVTPTPTAGGASTLWQVADVAGFTVTDRTKNATFSAELGADRTWQITEPPNSGVADQMALSTAASTLGSLFVNRTITETTDLADFGLLTPDYVLEVRGADGRVYSASVGKKAVTGSSYYVLRQGEANALLVSSFSLETLLSLPAAPPVVTPAPALTVEPIPGLPTPASP